MFIDDQKRTLQDIGGYALDRVHRIEIIDRGSVIRTYTTRFMADMLAGHKLGPIVLVPGTVLEAEAHERRGGPSYRLPTGSGNS